MSSNSPPPSLSLRRFPGCPPSRSRSARALSKPSTRQDRERLPSGSDTQSKMATSMLTASICPLPSSPLMAGQSPIQTAMPSLLLSHRLSRAVSRYLRPSRPRPRLTRSSPTASRPRLPAPLPSPRARRSPWSSAGPPTTSSQWRATGRSISPRPRPPAARSRSPLEHPTSPPPSPTPQVTPPATRPPANWSSTPLSRQSSRSTPARLTAPTKSARRP